MAEYYSSSSPMSQTSRIVRRSIFTLLKNLHHFTSTPAFLLLPFAAITLLSQPLLTSSYLFPIVHGRLRSLFLAAGFPPSSELFAILNLKLSQTLLSSLFILPFTLSFLLLSKALIIFSIDRHIQSHKTKSPSLFSRILIAINPLITTQLCSSLVILSANATCFTLLIIAFNCFDLLGISSNQYQLLLSATGAIVYSIVLANAYIICNLSLIVSVITNRGGFNSILRACVLIKGRTATALSLALPMNMALAAIEALFQYRVVRDYNRARALDFPTVLEATLVAYLYAIVVVLDTIVGYVFLKSCKSGFQDDEEDNRRIEIREGDGKVKDFELVL